MVDGGSPRPRLAVYKARAAVSRRSRRCEVRGRVVRYAAGGERGFLSAVRLPVCCPGRGPGLGSILSPGPTPRARFHACPLEPHLVTKSLDLFPGPGSIPVPRIWAPVTAAPDSCPGPRPHPWTPRARLQTCVAVTPGQLSLSLFRPGPRLRLPAKNQAISPEKVAVSPAMGMQKGNVGFGKRNGEFPGGDLDGR
ncbi:LOW QUALITY PROTEIN: hypothetical protein MC885_011240 [Smutsia gigantea]|nr:LOW QUALITY PROTEIN: hypothetical protein MC885_011240 [Smutsia gigantea]